MNEKEIIKNLERCPSFIRCSQNLCPLDFKLSLRVGVARDRCKWMKESEKKKVGDKEFISGNKTMPDELLKFVPEYNYKRLNKTSQHRWEEIVR